jgi:FtsP/CotA-like multicopper oxidase with cupredoxin domain
MIISTDGSRCPAPVVGFRIGVAETYDVIVTPTGDAHTIFTQNIDRSGLLPLRAPKALVLLLPPWTRSGNHDGRYDGCYGTNGYDAVC